uniref:Uncharacterized protein n=1 Tax=Chaetoceros debilis TaxID=122233 RepID=A0A7S3QBP5_9STRA
MVQVLILIVSPSNLCSNITTGRVIYESALSFSSPPPSHSWNEYLSHSSQGFIATILHVTMLTSYIIYGTFEDAYRDGIFYFRDVVYGMSRLQKCHFRTAGRGIDYAVDLNEEDRGADEESRGTPTNMIHQILNHIHAQDGAGVCSNYNITWRKLIQVRNIRSSASSLFWGNQLLPSRRRLWQKGSMDLDLDPSSAYRLRVPLILMKMMKWSSIST